MPPNRPFATLRRFVRERDPAEACELCNAALLVSHAHLIEPASRRILCACEACAILFSDRAAARYKRIPRRLRYLSDFRLSDAQWESLMIPINMAFFFTSTPAARTVAIYPSPAGPTESSLDLQSWDEIAAANPVLNEMQPDVEALLVSRTSQAQEVYLVPIDECYKLVGLIRANWRGLSGGAEVWQALAEFFAGLRQRTGAIEKEARA